MSLATVKKIVDEALELGFESINFTGGEPFILDEITEMLAYSSARLPTTVLTNAMLLSRRRFKELLEINSQRLSIQVSLDGSRPEHHDPYRGQGSWQKTVDGLQMLLDSGFRVRISTTETPANEGFLEEICDYRRSLGISDKDHIIRPLAKRGFSKTGMEIGKQSLAPEMTINAEGVFWHPLSTDMDLMVRSEIFPLLESVLQIQMELENHTNCRNPGRQEFH
jgi:MoaA/NifB/PqqE/SkfB family radical SAM enzyme